MGRCVGVEALVPVISFVFVRSYHLGSGYVSAPLPCRSANAGLSDYNIKKKKKKNLYILMKRGVLGKYQLKLSLANETRSVFGWNNPWFRYKAIVR